MAEVLLVVNSEDTTKDAMDVKRNSQKIVETAKLRINYLDFFFVDDCSSNVLLTCWASSGITNLPKCVLYIKLFPYC